MFFLVLLSTSKVSFDSQFCDVVVYAWKYAWKIVKMSLLLLQNPCGVHLATTCSSLPIAASLGVGRLVLSVI